MIILAIVAWRYIRVNIRLHTTETATLSNGLKVSVHLAEVRRVEPNRVRVKMDFIWEPSRGEELVLPDMAIVRPHAVRAWVIPELITAISKIDSQADSFSCESSSGPSYAKRNGLCHAQYVAYFDLKESASTIDIVQPVYCRKPTDNICVGFPLTSKMDKNIVRKAGTATVELLDFGSGKKYGYGPWQVLGGGSMGNLPPVEGPPSDSFCVLVNQTDPDGPLVHWPVFAPGGKLGCYAELVGKTGEAVRKGFV